MKIEHTLEPLIQGAIFRFGFPAHLIPAPPATLTVICYDAAMSSPPPAGPLDAVTALARGVEGLDLLLLFGSRARGDTHAGSDWDLAYLADARLDVAGLLGAIVEAVGTDRVDLVDLSRAGGLLRYRAARDGRILFESRPRLGERFRLDAVDFWCDALPVLQRGYEDVLEGLTS